MTRRSIFLAALATISTSLGAQAVSSISGSVVGSNGAPLSYSTVSIVETGVARFTDEKGEFIMAGLSPGSYRLRVKQLGFVALDTVIALAARTNQRVRIELKPAPFKLTTVTVKASRSCPTAEQVATGSNFATILDELRTNAERERILVKSYPFVYRIARSVETPGRSGNVLMLYDTTSYRSDTRARYVAGNIFHPAPDALPRNNQEMTIPVLEDIGDPEFLRNHCFTYAGITREGGTRMHRIDYEPVKSLRTPDIGGSVFLDTASLVVRRATFRVTRADQVDLRLREMQVTTNYREIFPGVTVIGDVVSVQVHESGLPPQTRVVRLTEKQRLMDYEFLGTKPGGPPTRD